MSNVVNLVLLAVCIAICAHAAWLFRNGRQ